MPGQGKVIPAAGAAADQNIDFTFADLQAELRRLHEGTRPERQPGEFTIAEYAAAQNPPMEREKAKDELNYMVRTGKLEKPPLRFIGGKMRAVYKEKSG